MKKKKNQLNMVIIWEREQKMREFLNINSVMCATVQKNLNSI